MNVSIVARGVDTLLLNAYYKDEQDKPIKQELDATLHAQLRTWKESAIAASDSIPTTLLFEDQCLHIHPNGAGHGQYPFLLTCPFVTLCISTGQWNGIAQVRFSSEYLWSCESLIDAIVKVNAFLYDVFGCDMFLQVSAIDLCADIAGWPDLGTLNIRSDFVSRSRKRAMRAESDWVPDAVASYSYGLAASGLDFSPRGPMSCTIYDKTREIKKSGKLWMEDIWRVNGWNEDTDKVIWRIEFKFKREALHELKQGDVFHGLEDAYDLPDRLEVLWAYAAGQVDGSPDELPDGWLRCVVPNEDSNRSRWPTHPHWCVVQRAFTEACEMPVQFGKIVRKRKEQRNIDKAVEAIFGYATSMAAWEGDELSELDTDISTFLSRFVERSLAYQKRSKKDFAEEIQRKRVKLGLSTV